MRLGKRSMFLAMLPLLSAACATSSDHEPTATAVDDMPSNQAPAVNRTTHGYVEQDETWRDNIRIDGDVIVREGITLTIEPGTLVHIAANQDIENLINEPIELREGIQNEAENMYGVHRGEPWRDEGNHISILVNGTLHAVGTQDNVMTIRSDSETPGIYDWNRLNIHAGVLSHSVVENYRVLEPADGVVISHNVLRNIGECGVCANAAALIEDNTITNTGHELIDIHGHSPIIRNNHLGPSDNVGIIVDLGSPEIMGNVIEGCDIGIGIINPDSTPIIQGNTFSGNKQDIHSEG